MFLNQFELRKKMYNAKHTNGEPAEKKAYRKHATDDRSTSSSSYSYDCEAGCNERGCCAHDSCSHYGGHEHRKFLKHGHHLPHFSKNRGYHPFSGESGYQWSGSRHFPGLFAKDMDALPVTVHHGSMPILTRGVVMFHIVSETKPSITITNTGAIKVEANGVQLLNATLKENYPADKVVASYANKIVTIRIPCDVVTSDPPVDIPITIHK